MKCLFCDIVRRDIEAAIVHEDDAVIGFLDHRPLFVGHVLLIPKQHVETLVDLPSPLIQPLFATAQRMARGVESAMEAEGTFIAINNRISQSVPHLHVHIVPRRKGDGLRGFFWPRTKYASGELETVRGRIKEALGQSA